MVDEGTGSEHAASADASAREPPPRPSPPWRSSSLPMAIVDAAGRLVDTNRGFERLVRADTDALRDRFLGELWDVGDTFASPRALVRRLHDEGAIAVFATRNP